MGTDRHRQLCFSSDPAGAVVLAGDRVRVLCGCCGRPQIGAFAVARVFRTGAITVFDTAGKQRHVAPGRFVLILTRGGAMALMIGRRGFLGALLAAPFVARAELLMPVRALLLPALLPGDLVSFHWHCWRRFGIFAVCEAVKRIEGDMVVTTAPSFDDREIVVPRSAVTLFEGYSGNRVNNPSMQHRLIRPPGRIGLSYPEDLVSA